MAKPPTAPLRAVVWHVDEQGVYCFAMFHSFCSIECAVAQLNGVPRQATGPTDRCPQPPALAPKPPTPLATDNAQQDLHSRLQRHRENQH